MSTHLAKKPGCDSDVASASTMFSEVGSPPATGSLMSTECSTFSSFSEGSTLSSHRLVGTSTFSTLRSAGSPSRDPPASFHYTTRDPAPASSPLCALSTTESYDPAVDEEEDTASRSSNASTSSFPSDIDDETSEYRSARRRRRRRDGSVLHNLIQNQKWESAVKRANTNPQEVSLYGRVKVRGSSARLLPIHLACTMDPPVDVVNALIKADASCVTAADMNGRTALHWACDSCGSSSDVVRLLVQAYPQAVKLQEKKFGFLPLHIACFRPEDHDIFDTFLSKESSLGEKGDIAAHVVATLLKSYSKGASIKDDLGSLPLHIVCRTNPDGEHIARSLLRAYPEAALVRDEGSRLPLHWACCHRYRLSPDAYTDVPGVTGYKDAQGLVSALLDVKPEAASKRERNYGFLPLHIACSSGASPRVVNALIKSNPEAARKQDRNGSLPLHIACRASADEEVISSLLDCFPEGAQFQDANSRLPLHWACHVGSSSSLVNALLRAFSEGAQLTEAKYGFLPLHVACKRGAEEDVIAALLLSFPEASQTRDNHGNLPIHLACSNCAGLTESAIGMLLLAFPESLEREDQQGCTPLVLVENGNSCNRDALATLLQSQPSGWRALSFPSASSASVDDEDPSSFGRLRLGFFDLRNKDAQELIAVLQKNEDEMRNNLLCASSGSMLSGCDEEYGLEEGYEAASYDSPTFDVKSGDDALVKVDFCEQVGLDARGDSEQAMVCVLCLVNPVNYILYPCGHPCLCETCARAHLQSLNNVCPVGRCTFQDAVRVYGRIVKS